MVLDTRHLFSRLLKVFGVETVCDVGSMDGREALLFRRMVPQAAVLALEPSPRNYRRMTADAVLRRNSIRIFPVAAGNRVHRAPFHVVDPEYAAGASSLHRPAGGSRLVETVDVSVVRLDGLLTAERRESSAIALWIDTEGTAFEVIEGCSGILESTRMLHVEVESEPIIGVTQRLFADIERMLLNSRFMLVATDQPPEVMQFNALFVRSDLVSANAAAIARLAAHARRRRVLEERIAPYVPRRVRIGLGLPVTGTRLR